MIHNYNIDTIPIVWKAYTFLTLLLAEYTMLCD